MMTGGVKKRRSSLSFSMATGPTLKNYSTVGTAPPLYKHLRLKVEVCVS